MDRRHFDRSRDSHSDRSGDYASGSGSYRSDRHPTSSYGGGRSHGGRNTSGGFGYEGGRGRGGGGHESLSLQGPMTEDELDPAMDPASAPSTSSWPERLGYGRLGTKMTVLVNLIKVTIKKKILWRYDVDISEDFQQGKDRSVTEAEGASNNREVKRQKQIEGRAVIAQLAMDLGWGPWVHDGRATLFALDANLPGNGQNTNVRVKLHPAERERPYRVKLTRQQNSLDLAVLERFLQGHDEASVKDVIQALDIATRCTTALRPDVINIGDAVYFADGPTNQRPLDNMMKLRLGYRQTLVLNESGAYLNVDTAIATFMQDGPLLDVIRAHKQRHRDARPADLTKLLKNARVRVKYTSNTGGQVTRTFAIKRFEERNARNYTFRINEGDVGEISLYEYFREKYGVTLMHPDEEVICVNEKRGTCFPAEFFELLPQRSKKSADAAAMIDLASKPPREFVDHLQWCLRHAGAGEGGLVGDPTLAAFGVSLDEGEGGEPELLRLEARVLQPPTLRAGQHSDLVVNARQGEWRDIMRKQFVKPVAVTSWAFLIVDPDTRPVAWMDEFAGNMHQKLREQGMTGPSSKVRLDDITIELRRGDDLEEAMRAVIDRAVRAFGEPPHVILCALSAKKSQAYYAVKHISEELLGVITQCFVPMPGKMKLTYCMNLALKINAKLGGSNVYISPSGIQGGVWLPAPLRQADKTPKSFMLVGIDVSHTLSREENSVVAVVGSMDKECTQYATVLSVNPVMNVADQERVSGNEVVNEHNLGKSIEKLIGKYSRLNGELPQVIMVYRDGVSEGQFKELKDTEIAAIQKACQEMGDEDDPYTPSLVFITVLKRHHIRLFPDDKRNVTSSGNVLPGTVVDRCITSREYNDFYLMSHAGLKGTSRCAHYFVLHDDLGFRPDELQRFTYWLSYLYCSSDKSVSICPPAYYADIAAMRGANLRKGGPYMDIVRDQGVFINVKDSIASNLFYA